MADITTIAQFKTAFESNDYDSSGVMDIDLQNDLDFNNENYYYKNGIFFEYTEDSGSDKLAITKNINFNNHAMANIFLKKDSALFVAKVAQASGLSARTFNLNFYDGTFEVVSDFGVIMSCLYRDDNTDKSSLTQNIKFQNCIFNVKTMGQCAGVNNSNQYALFGTHKNGTSQQSKANVYFINCVFNIELTPACVDFNCILSALSSISMNIESCEFRIKDKASSVTNHSENALICYAYSSIPFHFNNNIIFWDCYNTDRGTVIKLLNRTSTAKNNFLGSLKEYQQGDTKTSMNFSGMQSIFYDSDKFTVNTGGTTVVGLTTAQCKDRDSLENAGYIFANEA